MTYMGLFQKGYPFHILKKYFPDRDPDSFKNGIVIRYVCTACEKHSTEKLKSVTENQLRGIPLRRKCPFCGAPVKVENIFEDRRSGKKR